MQQRRLRLLAVTASIGLLIGCGSGEPVPAPSVTQRPATAPAPSAPSATVPNANDPKSQTKWINGIPYDVFYDQPLEVASDSTSLTPNVTTPPPSTTPAEPSATTDTPSSPKTTAVIAAGGPDWQQLASAEVLNEEVQKLRNSLNANLAQLGTYNRNVEPIALDGSTLAALAAVLEVHPDAVSWQDNARYVRDLGDQISLKADGTGREQYTAAKEPFEQVVTILNGGPPPEMEAEEKVPFSDIADRSELMKRIKISFDFLKAEINTEDRFQESPADVTREAAVLASFGGIISTDSYDSADEEKYQQFVGEFMQANVDVQTAAREGDFTKFEQARSRVLNACNTCHAEYSFGSDGL